MIIYWCYIDIKRMNINGFWVNVVHYFPAPSPSPCFCLFAPLIFAQYCCQCSMLLLLGLWKEIRVTVMQASVFFFWLWECKAFTASWNCFSILSPSLELCGGLVYLWALNQTILLATSFKEEESTKTQRSGQYWLCTMSQWSICFYLMGDLSIALSFAIVSS